MLENLENALVIALGKPEYIDGIRQVNLAAFNGWRVWCGLLPSGL